MKDSELITSALNNDQKAFSVLIDKYYQYTYNNVLKIVKNEFEAEDLTTEAFEKAFNNLDKYVPTHSFRSWLQSVAHNHSIDFIRKKGRQSKIIKNGGQNYELLTERCQDLNSEELIIKEETFEQLRLAISKLKQKHRDVIEKRYFCELSYEELATELDIPLSAVKMRLFHAKQLLKEMLKPAEESLSENI